MMAVKNVDVKKMNVAMKGTKSIKNSKRIREAYG